MDRAALEQLLEQRLSLAEIGRRVELHESTVGYWVKKHGLEVTNRGRYEAKGGLSRAELTPLVEAGMSIAEIAESVGRSKATVRHWLTRYALKTHGALGRRVRVEATRAREAGLDVVLLECKHHGETAFVLDQRGYYRCKRCRSASVSRRRRRVKGLLVAEAGGACSICGYSRNARALHFHHLDPPLKRMEINARGAAVAIDRLRAEARKCVLVCANCHAEIEAGLVSLASDGSVRVE
ncbi:MAG TPA: helix-turn-helix domain-containing protein [Solirubrobacteraceae bacterium]|nr:helix-turn-helix domain-containing protein [Solirubrobacteraceae bacterium]